jgi:hypothetical protein
MLQIWKSSPPSANRGRAISWRGPTKLKILLSIKPLPGLIKSSPHTHTLYHKSTLILSPIYPYEFQVVTSLQIFLSKFINVTGRLLNVTVHTYEDVSKSFRTGRLERELQMIQLSATRCSCIGILWVSLVSFAAITFYVASQRVFVVVSVYFVIDSVRNFLYTSSYQHYVLCSSF